jgi:hypothetical protein
VSVVPDREPHSIRLDPDLYSEFVGWVEDTEGKKRGEIGRHVENALKEYIDHGREARIEEKVDQVLARLDEQPVTHTHKQRGSETVEKVRRIQQRLTSNHGRIIKSADVDRAIEDIAGADDRTIKKYYRMLKRRSLLFEHPGDSGVWTADQERWVKWCDDKINNEPELNVHDLTDEYAIEYDEYITKVEAVTADD